MEAAPLRQVLEPGEYRVRWALPDLDGSLLDREGDLELRAERPPTGAVYDVPVERTFLADGSYYLTGPQVRVFELIRGQLLNGMSVVLLDAEVTTIDGQVGALTATAALVGHTDDDSLDNAVSSLEIQLHGLDAVAGVGPIKWVNFPGDKKDARYLDRSWHADGNPDSTQVWKDDGAEITLKFYNSVSPPNGFIYRVLFSPVLVITISTPLSLRDALTSWVEPLRRIISLSTGEKEAVTYLGAAVGSSGASHPFQVYGSRLTQSPYASDANVGRRGYRSFQFGDGGPSLLEMLRSWQALRNAHHPLLETYAEMMYAPTQHPRSELLTLLQALEGLYGYETRDAYDERLRTHAEQRKSVVAEIRGVVSAAAVAFVKKHLARRPGESLDHILRHALGGLPRDLTDELTNTDLLQRVTRDKTVGASGPFDALRIVRNDLAHGNRGYDARELDDVVRILDGAVRAHLLRLLGASAAVQEREQARRENGR